MAAINYEKMTTEELGQHRSDLKRAYQAELAKSTEIYRRKVTDDLDRATEKAHSMAPGTIHSVITPPPAEMGIAGVEPGGKR